VTAELRAVRDRLLRDRGVVSRLDGSVHTLSPVAIGAAEGEALAGRVRDEGASRTIEIGLGYAISTLYICEALLENAEVDGGHFAIDPHQWTRFANCGLQVLEDAGVSALVEVQEEESQLVLPRLVGEGRRFDLAFVDGDHRFDGVFLDLVYLGRLVRPGGILFVDDYQLPAVQRAVAFFHGNLAWKVEDVSRDDPDHHWVVVRTAAEPVERAWDFFVDF
jgi:predicted O-methyltransferase YrrM